MIGIGCFGFQMKKQASGSLKRNCRAKVGNFMKLSEVLFGKGQKENLP
jgi:hypothetical protein